MINAKRLRVEGEQHSIKSRMMCRAVRGAQFRLIYRYDADTITVISIELDFKGTKQTEDTARILNYLK